MMKRPQDLAGLPAPGGKRVMLGGDPPAFCPWDGADWDNSAGMDVQMLDDTTEEATFTAEHVCYGAFPESKAKLGGPGISTIHCAPWNQHVQLHLSHRGPEGSYQISHQDSGGQTNEIGILDLVSSKYIDLLSPARNLTCTVVLSSGDLDALKKKAKKTSIIIDVSVNVTGPAHDADWVAEILLQNKCYLQHPVFLSPGIKYLNPQYYYSGESKDDLRDFIGPASRVESQELYKRLQENLEDVLGSLAEVEPGADSVGVPLAGGVLRTQLKSHQLDAVRFILKSENQDIRHSTLRDLQLLVGTRVQTDIETDTHTGGILADVMGLGKTLTMLTAIASSKEAARQHKETCIQNDRQRISTKGTLVVVTSRQVLEVWKTEIENHFHPGSLSLGIFHGTNRTRNSRDLSDHDVVVTTYSTLMADWSPKGRRVLQAMAWFRVVLDEAHWIRNSSTKQFRAARDLQAKRRWCVTGTPIQNSLNDLLSLLKFLHLQPFCQPAVFEQDILDPIRSGTEHAFQNLKLLLRTVCLRRNSQLLNLEPVNVETVSVALNAGERDCYRAIQARCQAEFEMITSKQSQLKRYSVLFSTIIKLRRLCSNGQLHAPQETEAPGNKGTGKGKKRGAGTGVDSVCDFCGDEDAASLLEGLDFCPECSSPLVTKTKPSSDMSSTPRHLAPGSPLTASPSRSPSPLPGTPSWSAVTSSKLNAVADNIENHRDEGKNLVFTSWLSTLDSLRAVLESRGIPCLQIDGRVSTSEREERLQRFKHDSSINVLLMSIQTGSVGLTLTVANRVHFVEPQWNPAVEEQAVGRAQRMGQTRRVTVVRYITEKSVEETIAALQKKKSHLAKVSLDAAEHNGETTGLDDLKFVLDHDVMT